MTWRSFDATPVTRYLIFARVGFGASGSFIFLIEHFNVLSYLIKRFAPLIICALPAALEAAFKVNAHVANHFMITFIWYLSERISESTFKSLSTSGLISALLIRILRTLWAA